jgi:hypothetical protein
MMNTTELREIRNAFQGLQTLYHTYLPKADPVLLHDILTREQEKSERAPFYMVEVFTKKVLIRNGVKIIYGKLRRLFLQHMIMALTM